MSATKRVPLAPPRPKPLTPAALTNSSRHNANRGARPAHQSPAPPVSQAGSCYSEAIGTPLHRSQTAFNASQSTNTQARVRESRRRATPARSDVAFSEEDYQSGYDSPGPEKGSSSSNDLADRVKSLEAKLSASQATNRELVEVCILTITNTHNLHHTEPAYSSTEPS
jgi:hypothetical protein